MTLKESLEAYRPYNEQEEKDKALLLEALLTEKNVFSRENRFCHFTASAWIVNKERTKILLCYHNLYQSWTWLGGHADGNENLLEVCEKEIREEAGIQSARPLLGDQIFSLESLSVDGHVKQGEYVSTHLHLNVTYLFEADSDEILTVKPDENAGLKWCDFDDVLLQRKEPWYNEHIYPKLNAKLRAFIQTGHC